MNRRGWSVVATIALGGVLASCVWSGGESGSTPGPPGSTSLGLRWTDCPSSIESSFISRHRCGILTVPQDRTDQVAGTLDLTVVQAWPVGVEARPGLGVGFGSDLGDPTGLDGNMATGATRMAISSLQFAFRGTAGQPRLTCPEVDALDDQAPALPDSDPGLRSLFVAAVQACGSRLRANGTDPADFGTQEAAADVEDLRRAVGIDAWTQAGSYGTQSRVLFRYLQDFPGRLTSAYLDSPAFPETDDLSAGVEGTRSALAELFRSCTKDPSCRSRYPRLQRQWEQALRRLAETPLRGRADVGGSDPVEVVVDAAKLLRFVRFSLGGDGTENLTWVPMVIQDAAHGRLNAHLARLVATDPVFCAGYRPHCARGEPFSVGVFLTVLCKEQLPGLDTDRLRATTRGQPAYAQVFARSPWVEACPAWGVAADAAPPPAAEPGATRLLLLPGQFDSFSRPEWSVDHARSWAHAGVFTAPANTHNTLGYDECALSVRNAWVRAPERPPEPTLCTSPAAVNVR